MLQEAVDALFDNGRRGRPVTGPGNRPLKSLSDMLKGKQGRFRQNLLGKRVDYSGRSVIVAGPYLKLHQCGLPKLMALELFKPFIMAQLVERKAAQNIKAAKKMVDSMIPEVWDVLEQVIHEHPVLLNRAPTLHRLGIQAFEPVLVEGKAIQVHPLVCHAFNADFDGDQMAVHLPLSAEAQAEARILMLSSNNILSPAHGAPLATPTQDMILGAYYLTYGPEPEELAKVDRSTHDPRPHVYRTAQEAELSYELGGVKLHDLAEFRPLGREGGHVLTTVGRIIYNDRIERALLEAMGDEFDPTTYEFINRSMKKRDTTELVDQLVQTYGATTISQVLDAFKDLGFEFATKAGITISKNDVVIPPSKGEIVRSYEKKVAELTSQYDMGLITQEERHEAIVEQWNACTEEVADAMVANLDVLNPIFMMANSGARGSFKQIRQLAGMRGLMANPKGDIIERPVKANFMEGLDVLEYFTSTHGARKGLADTALRTADSGYLTRRLVDVAQDVIIREADCGTEEFIELPLYIETGDLNANLLGRFAAREIATKRGRVIVEKGGEIDRPELGDIIASADQLATDNHGVVKIAVRSVLKCEATSGVCQSCYGRSMASGKTAQIGDAVGIIAAQSIGEPGTQLTMRTFHTGGVAGADITHGLPRVVELFEARKPKGLAKIAEQDGVITIEDSDKALTVVITDDAGEEHRHTFPRRTRLFVENGQRVEAGTQLNEGSLYPHELLAIRGRTETEQYQRQAHRADRAPDAQEGARRPEGRHGLPPRGVRRPLRVRARQRRHHRQGRRGGPVRGHHPRHHEGVAEHRLLPLGGLLPGDDEGVDRCRPGGQDRPPQRPEGERDHRQADPGGHRLEALPAHRDRAGGAAAAGDGRCRPARPGRDRRRARARRRRRPGRLRLSLQRGHRLAGGDRHGRRGHRLRRGARRPGRARRARVDRGAWFCTRARQVWRALVSCAPGAWSICSCLT
jgi:DNA-directed RNA polymerase subunit beta'